MSDSRFRQVAADYFVAPQLTAADFAAARAMGIRTVINNRPDGEAPDQLSDVEARKLAQEEGLSFASVPVASGGIQPEAMLALAEALENNPGPYLAYCRSGTRSTYLWALQEARHRPPEEIVAAAAAAGYDIAAIVPLLHRISSAG